MPRARAAVRTVSRQAVLLCLVVLGVAILGLVTLQYLVRPQQPEASALVLLLALLTGSAGTAAALLCVFAARLTGDPRTTWLGLGLAWYCLLTLPLTTAHLLGPSHRPLLEAGGFVAHVSTALVLLVLLRAPEPPSVRGVLQGAGLGVLTAGATTAVLGVRFPQLAVGLDELVPLGVGLSLAWVAAGLAVTLGRPTWVHGSIGAGLALLGAAQLWRALTPAPEFVELAPAFAALRLGAVLVILGSSLRLTRHALVDLDREQADRERELRRAEAEIERAQHRDHELRNGLAGLAGATRLFGRDELVSRAVASELRRLDVMLDGGSGPEPMTTYAIAPVIEGLVALRAGTGRELHVHLGSGLWAIGSSRTLAAVVTNVLANCERHAPGSPVEITTRVRAGQVVLEIRDHGPGIRPGDENRVFQPGVFDRDAGGRGVGLALCRALLVAEGGSIDIAPADPERPGCVVRVVLPGAPQVVRPAVARAVAS